MFKKIEVRGTGGIVSKLDKRRREALSYKAEVGYKAPYAIYVHENLAAYHKPPTKAKFLEGPFRENRGRVGKLLTKLLKSRVSMYAALMEVCEFVLNLSQPFVPVLTGRLKRSKYKKVSKL